MKSTTTNKRKRKEYSMNQIFDLNETRRQQIIIEYLTPTKTCEHYERSTW